MDIKLDLLIAQIINFLVIFFIFKHFLWNKIVAEIEKRKILLQKIKNAEDEYKNIIQTANGEASEIINKALDHKSAILEESKKIADQDKVRIIDAANKKAEEIYDQTKISWEKLKKELTDSWEEWVKSTAKLVVKKLFEDDVKLQDGYISKIIKEIKS